MSLLLDQRLGWSLLLLFILQVGVAEGQPRGADTNAFTASCKLPLKFMAGACVPECYAGYEDRGGWCELKRGGGGGGGK